MSAACCTLRNLFDPEESEKGRGFRRESDLRLLSDIVATLAVRYSRYVPTMFGTRLSPRLAAELRSGAAQDAVSNRSESSSGKKTEGERQAKFLGDVVWMAGLLLATLDPAKENGKPELLERIIEELGHGGLELFQPLFLDGGVHERLRSQRDLADWAVLWLVLAMVDLGGCGALLTTIAHHPLFRERSGAPLRGRSKDGQSGKHKATTEDGETVTAVRQALEAIFPPRSSGTPAGAPKREAGTPPAAPSGPLLACLLLRTEMRASAPAGSPRGDGANGGTPLEAVPGNSGCDDSRGPSLVGLATAWLAVAICIETGLLRRRHFHEGAGWRERLKWLWRTTREALFSTLEQGVDQRSCFHLPSGADDDSGDAGECLGQAFGQGFTLRIDSLWLNAYLLHRITFEMDPKEVLEAHFPEGYLAMVFLRRFAQLTAYVCWGLATRRTTSRNGGPPRVLGRGVTPIPMDAYTGALIELVDVYAHHVLEVPFEVHVGRFLRHFLEDQAPLYVLKDHYRDHLYHVIDVFLLGDFLLRARLGEERVLMGEVLEDQLARAASRTVQPSRQQPAGDPVRPDLWKNWCVAALCHDLGYPLLIHRAALERSERAPIGETLRAFVDGLHDALHGHLEEVQSRLAQVFTEGVPPGPPPRDDHGAISAIIVHDHLRQADWARGDGPLLRELRPAAVAIFLHGLVQRAIPVEDAPLAYFLAFCDEVQDWGRARPIRGPIAPDITWAFADPGNWQLRAEPVLAGLDLTVERLEPTGAVLPGPTGETARVEEETHIDLAQVYRQEAAGILDPIFLWVSKARNFERLAASSLPWRPRLCIVTPIPERLRRIEVSYLHVLARVAHRYEELNLRAFVHHLARAWDEAPPRDRRKPVDPQKTHETVLLNLELLAEDRPLRAFETSAGYGDLANAIEAVIREIEEGYRQRGQALWRLGGKP